MLKKSDLLRSGRHVPSTHTASSALVLMQVCTTDMRHACCAQIAGSRAGAGGYAPCRYALLGLMVGQCSAGFEVVSKRLSDHFGHRDAVGFCAACEPLFEFGVESDGFDG